MLPSTLAIVVLAGLVTMTQARGLARTKDEAPRFDSAYRCTLDTGHGRIEFDPGNPVDLAKVEQDLKCELDAAPETPSNNAKRARRGLHEIHRLMQALVQTSDENEELRLRTLLLETTAAVNNLCRPPTPEKVDFFQTPWFFLKRLSRPVGQGQIIAANLHHTGEPDLSRLDPEPFLFWSRPAAINKSDLFHGFDRTTLQLPGTPLCTYAGPKESFGRNPGFEVECDGRKLKLKFAEVCSEPFASRIFFALGYHTDPTDYAPTVRVRYSRRILLEFNSRRPLQTHFTFFGFIPLFTLELQQRYDPFEYFTTAVLKNGKRWSSAELKRRLFRDSTQPHPEGRASNFRPEIESAIDWLETVPANVQLRQGKSIGPWDFDGLDHCQRRELRGAGLLAAWLGWFDTRFDNTRLRILKDSGQTQLEGYFSDLGGVLGKTTGMLYSRGELPNAFPWTFTKPPALQGAHRLARPFRLSGYKPITPTPAFAAMNIDDARWMGRLIGALREQQIKQALVASGFDSAQTRLYLEKLMSRRDQMIRDLGLVDELGLLRPSGINRRFSYNPVLEGVIRIKVEGKAVQASAGGSRIIKGKLTQ